MMKKAFAAAFAVLLATSMLLAGCTTPASNPTKAPADGSSAATEKPSDNAVAPAIGGGTLTEAYTRLLTAKGDASTRLSNKMDANSDLALYGMALLPVTLYDLALLPVTVADVPEAAETTLGILGMTGVDVKKAGNTYTISYTSKNSEGVETKAVQTCEYDPATESIKSSIKDESGKETMTFESVKAGSLYATQYYVVDDKGSMSVSTMVFNSTDLVAIGIHSATEKPASIYKNTSVTADLVKSAEMYMILEGDKLTIHENGEDKTY